MKDRITQIIEKEKITPAEFADQIGIQRSSLSHVLNGRNNPGFSFIHKILDAYPDINSRWLLTGKGDMYNSSGAAAKSSVKPEKTITEPLLFSSEKPVMPEINPIEANPLQSRETLSPTVEPEKAKSVVEKTSIIPKTLDKQVVRVLIFYNDHTFEDFRPAE